MNKEDIEEIILSWFKKKNIKLKDLNENFIYSKKIDSMESIQLIIFIEEKFKYKFKKKDLMSSNFFTVKKITKLSKMQNIDKKELLKKIKMLGLKRGDTVYCHNNLSFFF